MQWFSLKLTKMLIFFFQKPFLNTVNYFTVDVAIHQSSSFKGFEIILLQHQHYFCSVDTRVEIVILGARPFGLQRFFFFRGTKAIE